MPLPEAGPIRNPRFPPPGAAEGEQSRIDACSGAKPPVSCSSPGPWSRAQSSCGTVGLEDVGKALLENSRDLESSSAAGRERGEVFKPREILFVLKLLRAEGGWASWAAARRAEGWAGRRG